MMTGFGDGVLVVLAYACGTIVLLMAIALGDSARRWCWGRVLAWLDNRRRAGRYRLGRIYLTVHGCRNNHVLLRQPPRSMPDPPKRTP